MRVPRCGFPKGFKERGRRCARCRKGSRNCEATILVAEANRHLTVCGLQNHDVILKRTDLALAGVFLIEPNLIADERGFFLESYHREKFAGIGIHDVFVQDNHSKSVKGTLRGLHYQLNYPQAKLCRVISGEVLDVVVDVRKGSPTFGSHVSALLSAENKTQMYVPIGFAHGFVVLSETAEFLYKCSDFYHREDDRGIAWDDPDIGIDWNVTDPILSDKDRHLLRLSEVADAQLPVYRGSQ